MAFEVLLNKPMSEPQLLKLLVTEIQKTFALHQKTFYFFKLKEITEKSSEIIWQKTFNNSKDYADFTYESKFCQAAIMFKFKIDRYEVFCRGFHYLDVFEVLPDKTANSRPMEGYHKDCEKTPMPPRELIEKGFGEITGAMVSAKSKMPV